MKKIVFVSSLGRESSTFLGRLLPLASELSKKGFNVSILLLHYKYRRSIQKKFIEKNSIVSYYIGQGAVLKDEKSKKYFPFLKLIFVLATSSFRIFKALLKEKDVDVIIVSKPHPHNFLPAILAAKIMRKKLILDSDDLEYASNKDVTFFQEAVLRVVEKIGVRFCDGIFACSPFLCEHYEKLGVKKEKIIFLPTGIDISIKREVEKENSLIKKEFGLPEGHHIILYFGSLSISSGHRLDLLLSAFKKVLEGLNNVFLVIAGSGEDYYYLKEKAKSLRIIQKVKFLGRFSLETAFSLIKVADIIVDPIDKTFSNQAKSSFRLTEAMYFKKPFISLNSGIRAYFKYGFLVNNESNGSFAKAIKNVISNEEIKEEITNISEKQIEEITFPVLAGKAINFLNNLK